MKILRVIPSMDPLQGGPCQGVRNSIPELEKLNVTNEVVCFDEPSSSFIKEDNFKIYALGAYQTSWKFNSNFARWFEYNFNKYDVIIIHGLWNYHSYLVNKIVSNQLKRAKTSTVKVFVMPHGMLDPWFQKASNRKLKAIRNTLYWHLIEKHVINNADGVLFTTNEELLLARTTFSGYKPKKELNVGYGIQPPPLFDTKMKDCLTKFNISNDPYILFMSRIDIKKGVELLIRAYIKLKEHYHNIPKLIIAGPGLESPYGTKMVELANNIPEIIFTGMLTGDQKWSVLYGCEVFILPSHQENFGIVLAEAMACGKAVLTTNKVNIQKEIINHSAGIITDDTESGIYDSLKSWCDKNQNNKLEMQENANNLFKNNYSIESAAKSFLNSIRQY
ncbi:glycosyltransferase involved in cell wall biosynthesis [Dyadobacter jejuensis]|uniref:Glycosyltransferase involved in cell wall biosynthesis n=1 Tax=Dyadobacter jejuensis TaxID=1082580 RepID=A0A316AGD7_9BACT|nr:glycosyltransferase [Dyadobacter jejuensis]PWJ55984.1 glycosyltransferase involved in cell wall biosynthesis [Dyadobacter jejuensis]